MSQFKRLENKLSLLKLHRNKMLKERIISEEYIKSLKGEHNFTQTYNISHSFEIDREYKNFKS